jgi:hypothetical protein
VNGEVVKWKIRGEAGENPGFGVRVFTNHKLLTTNCCGIKNIKKPGFLN